jgi:hypothetical protein
MASLLEGAIAKAIYAGFRGKLLKGTLRRNAVSGGLDGLGDAAAATPADYPLEGFRDTYSAYTRAAAGIPDTDAKLVILARSVSVRPQQGDRIWLCDAWWQIKGVPETDPATATYSCQGYVVPGSAP